MNPITITTVLSALVAGCATLFVESVLAADAQRYDLLLLDGTLVDGTGAPAREADLAIREGQIVAIGDLDHADAALRLRIAGQVVAPGFIDVHSHADRALGNDEAAAMEGYLRQGVTTAVFGVDGFSTLDELKEKASLAAAGGSGINFLSYIGHNSVREAVLGNSQAAPSPAELERMQGLVREAMEFGAVGLSTGLMYLPGRYAARDEVIALARVTAAYDGRYDSHVRNPTNALLESHRECLEIAAAAGVHAHPAHMKAVGGRNFGAGPELVALVEEYRRQGHDVTVDVYPYDGAATAPVINLLYPGFDPRGEALMARIRPLLEGEEVGSAAVGQLLSDLREYWGDVGDDASIIASARKRTERPPADVFSWISTVGYESLRLVVSQNPDYEGQLVTALAAESGVTPFEFLRRIIIDEGSGAAVTLGAILEEDVRVLLTQPWTMVASDGEELAPSHPRGRGTFARLLGRYVREWQVLSLEDAVHKVTGLPAAYLKLHERGIVREGSVADLVVFDAERISDRASWSDPTRMASGVTHVFIGGSAAILDGELQPRRLGRYLPFGSAAPGDAVAATAPTAQAR